MRSARQALWGLLIALVSSSIILGSFALSLAEGGMTAQFPAGSASSQLPSKPPVTPLEGTTALPLPPTATHTPPPPPTNCPSPTGWQAYLVQPGDTLDELATRYRLPSEQIITANCLLTNSLLPGSYLYLPPIPTPTPKRTALACGAPAGWIRYTIQKGDTLYSLAQYYGVTVELLQQANCMNTTTLIAGKQIYVPNKPTRTPSPTPQPVFTFTPSQTQVTPSATLLPDTATPTGTNTPIPTNTEEPSATP